MSSRWEGPLCLIKSESSEHLEVDETTLDLLSKVPAPIVAVGVAGLYRTGKSYILNLLAGQTKGFHLGSTIQSCTKGIWVWCVEHPKFEGGTLLLMDTEGLGDVKKGDSNHDLHIFTLTTLLSSILVYNSKGTINNDAIEKLHFVVKMADHIKIKPDEEDGDQEFDKIFPSFVWAVRDFTLELKTIEGDSMTSDEYLKGALEDVKGKTSKARKQNVSRECIRDYFSEHKCFTFPIPLADSDKMKDLESMSEDQLAPRFLKVANELRTYIYAQDKPKLAKGFPISGKMFAGLTRQYVDAIVAGRIPCVENAVETAANIENSRAIKENVALYIKRMKEKAELPTESEAQLVAIDHGCKEDAIASFSEVAVFDDHGRYIAMLLEELAVESGKMFQRNVDASFKKCNAILLELRSEMDGNVESGKYMKAGGYRAYEADLNTVKQRYAATEGKGLKADESLHHFLEDKSGEGNSILAADETITEKEKESEEQRKRAETSDREKRLLEKTNKEQEQAMLDQQKKHQDDIRRIETIKAMWKAASDSVKHVANTASSFAMMRLMLI